ncbi:MAG: hypothetical protein HRT45_00840 [Bdellovibrionales bacterium]|nr:hypothetical protein [Bdellovibrionales bacterium]
MKLFIATLLATTSFSAFAFGVGNPADFPSMNGKFFQCSIFGNPAKCAELKAKEAERKLKRGGSGKVQKPGHGN